MNELNKKQQDLEEEIENKEELLKEHGDCDSGYSGCHYDEIWCCQISMKLEDDLKFLQAELKGITFAKEEILKEIEVFINKYKQYGCGNEVTDKDIWGKEVIWEEHFEELKDKLK